MSIFQSLLWLALGGLMRLFSFGRWMLPIADWFVPLFLIRFTQRVEPSAGSLVVWLVLWIKISSANRNIFHVPGMAYFGVSAIIAASFILPYLADRLIAPKLPGISGTLVIPMAWVTMELIVACTNPFGTWGQSPPHNMATCLMQLASVTGLGGILFVVSWFGPVVNWAWEADFEWEIVRNGVFICAGVLVVVLLASAARLILVRSKAKAIRMAVIGWPEHLIQISELYRSVQPKLSTEGRQEFRQKFEQVHDWFLGSSQREARAGAKQLGA